MSAEQIGIAAIGLIVAFLVLRAAVGCVVRTIVLGLILAAVLAVFLS